MERRLGGLYFALFLRRLKLTSRTHPNICKAMPRISICIPAYHAERYLAQALESVRCQTFSDWELIVTEDGSKDGAQAMTELFAGTVPQRVVYQRHEVNQGLPATRNTGISSARGELIALLDADDYWAPGHLESVLRRLLETGGDLGHAGSVLFEGDSGETLGIRAPGRAELDGFPVSLYVGDYIIQPSSVVLKRSLWECVGGFDPAFRYVEDREMWLRCARAGGRFVFSGENTCFYRKHGSALSTHSGAMAEAWARTFDKQLDWEAIPEALRRRSTEEAWIGAGRIFQRREPARAADCLARAWRVSHRAALLPWIAALRLYGLLTGK